jgi:hypothetical protein
MATAENLETSLFNCSAFFSLSLSLSFEEEEKAINKTVKASYFN